MPFTLRSGLGLSGGVLHITATTYGTTDSAVLDILIRLTNSHLDRVFSQIISVLNQYKTVIDICLFTIPRSDVLFII